MYSDLLMEGHLAQDNWDKAKSEVHSFERRIQPEPDHRILTAKVQLSEDKGSKVIDFSVCDAYCEGAWHCACSRVSCIAHKALSLYHLSTQVAATC